MKKSLLSMAISLALLSSSVISSGEAFAADPPPPPNGMNPPGGMEGGMNPPGGMEGGMNPPGGMEGGMNPPGGMEGGMNPPGGMEGGMNPPGGMEGGMNPPGGMEGGMNPPGGMEGGMNPPDGMEGGMNPPGGMEGGMNPPDGMEGGMNSPDGMEGGMNPPDGMEGGMNPPGGIEGGMNPPGGMEGGMNPPGGMEGGMNPPDGMEGGMNPPDGMEGGMNPPDGMEGGMNPPDGMEGGMNPPSGMEGGMNPPDGMEGGMNPPSGMEGEHGGPKPRPMKPGKRLEEVGIDPREMSENDISKMPPEYAERFDGDDIKMMSPEAVKGFKGEHTKKMPPKAMREFGPEHAPHMDKDAIKGFGQNIGELRGDFLQNLDNDQIGGLGEISDEEVKQMSERDKAKILANVDPDKHPEIIAIFAPPGWEIGQGNNTGKRPPLTPMMLPGKTGEKVDGLKMPEMPDMKKGFGLGGKPEEGCKEACDAESGMNKVLGPFKAKQKDDGILDVQGPEGEQFGFVPDPENMRQAPDGTPPGVNQNEEGQYVIITEDGKEIPVDPAPIDPEGVLNAINDGATDEGGRVEMQERGSMRMELPPGQDKKRRTVNCVFDFPVFDAPPDMKPGLHIDDGENEGTMVYEDGKAQRVKPMIQKPDTFKDTAKKFPGVKDPKVRPDGRIEVTYQDEGMPKPLIIILRPGFDVQPPPDDQVGQPFEPGIEPSENDGELIFTDDEGNQQPVVIEGIEDIPPPPPVNGNPGENPTPPEPPAGENTLPDEILDEGNIEEPPPPPPEPIVDDSV